MELKVVTVTETPFCEKLRRVQSRRSLHAKAIDDRLKTPKAVVWIDANPSSLSFVYGVCAVTAYRSIDLEV